MNKVMGNELKRPGYAMVVAKEGQIIESSYKETDDKTQFRIASLTKPFTGMATLMLCEGGEVGLDDKLSKYIKGLPGWAKRVGVRNLLNHTSGVPDHEQPLNQFQGKARMEDVLRVLKSQPDLMFTPGEKQLYSEAGYVLLAMIVEKVTGSYKQFLKKGIFQPLGLVNTLLFDETEPVMNNRAYGYEKRGLEYELLDDHNLNYIVGNEGIYSTGEDLSRWSKSWYSDVLVSEKILATALNSSYERGFSWKLGTLKGKKFIFHGGSWVGFRCLMAIVPKDKLSVVFLSNSTDYDSESSRLVPVLDRVLKYL